MTTVIFCPASSENFAQLLLFLAVVILWSQAFWSELTLLLQGYSSIYLTLALSIAA